MDLLKKSSSVRVIFFLATLLPAILLGSEMARNGASKGLTKKPSVQLHASKALLTHPCPPGFHSQSRSCPTSADLQVGLIAEPKGFTRQSTYVYTVTGGRVVGAGSNVTWDLSQAGPGFYTAVVEVQDNHRHRAESKVNVTLANCADCVTEEPCPQISVLCYKEVKAGTPITCNVVVGSSSRPPPTIFEWSTRDWNGEDLTGRISGQGKSISIRTDGLGGRHLETKVDVKKLDPSCSGTATGSTAVKP